MIVSLPPGQLGNILFNLAYGYSLSLRYSRPFEVALDNNIPIKHYLKYKDNLLKNFKIHQYNKDTDYCVYNYEELIYKELPNEIILEDKILLKGYYQSLKYFKCDFTSFKEKLSFDEDMKNKLKNIFKQFHNPICLHVRRGDYLKYPTIHPVIDMNYINSAKEYFNQECEFIVFSDDLEWCKNNIKGDNIFFWEQSVYNNIPIEVIELYAMSLCNNHIISNSSFSWWGAVLSEKSGKVIAPKKWFGPNGPKKWEDLYCNSWILV